MTMVLGLSITTTGIGWVLVDGSGADGNTLDHDAFDVNADAGVAGGCASQHAAAVRGAQAIAAASGHQVHSIAVTWSDDVEMEASRLLESLADSDFDNVVGVRLSQATQAWARGIARDLGYKNPAVCVIEPAAATVLTVGAGDGAVQTAVTHARDGAEGLSRWLTAVFDRNGEQPEGLYLVGSRSDLDDVAGSLDAALPMTVFSSAEDQLALARGAALSLADDAERCSDKPLPSRSWFASHTLTSSLVVVGSVSIVIALCAADSQPAAVTDFRAAANRPPADMSVKPTSAPSVPPPPVSPPPVPGLDPLAAPVPPQAPPATPPVGLAVPPPPPEVVDDPSAYPAAVAPVEASPEPIAPPAAPASSERLAPPPVEASHLPPGPPPAAGPVPTPPPPAPPPQPPPPQDPLGVVLSPLFGALP